MKKIIVIIMLMHLSMAGISQRLRDGLYIVKELVKDTATAVSPGATFVKLDPGFEENAPEGVKRLIVDTSQFTPLELEEKPQILPQAKNNKKLRLLFSKQAAEKLATFTSANMMKQATLVVDGRALTVNRIRAVIKDGRMEITRCSDNVCERIYSTLMDKMKERR